MKPLMELEGIRGSVGDEIFREFVWLATGRVIPPDQPIELADFSLPITETLINRLALLGLATLAYKTRRGCTKSGAYLVDRCLGSPQKPFKDQIQEMNLEQAQALLLKEFQEGLDINSALASDIVKRLVEKDTQSNG